MLAMPASDPASRPLPRVSVVVPVFNGGAGVEECLAAIAASRYPEFECILVDDGSTDGMAEPAAHRHSARLITLGPQGGPARARNRGAEDARGEILFFTDADVLLHPDALAIAVDALQSDPRLSAVFGSYDDQPGHRAFLSQYRNLYHHWVHQCGNDEAFTFWTGCGAIRRNVFLEMGGLRETYRRPSIEDIDLGARLRESGHRIRLEKKMLGKHMKHWTFWNLLKTDVLDRGVPWVELLLRQREAPLDLNLNLRSRLATVIAGVFAGLVPGLALTGQATATLPALAFLLGCSISALLFGAREPSRGATVLAAALVVSGPLAGFALWPDPLAVAPLGLMLALIGAEFGFYRYVARKRGGAFAVSMAPMRLIFYLGCLVAIPLGFFEHWLARIRARAGLAANP